MAACPKCQSVVAEGAAFCSVCGSPISVVSTPVPPPPPPPGAAVAGMSPNIAAALAYLPYIGFIVGIIFLVLEPYKRDRFVRFHAFQSIFLAVVAILFGIVWSNIIATAIFSLGFLWPLFSLISTLVYLAFFLIWLFAMYKAYNKEKYRLPVIGDMAEKQANK